MMINDGIVCFLMERFAWEPRPKASEWQQFEMFLSKLLMPLFPQFFCNFHAGPRKVPPALRDLCDRLLGPEWHQKKITDLHETITSPCRKHAASLRLFFGGRKCR